MFGGSSSKVTRQADAILIAGTYVFPEVYPSFSDVFAPGAKIIHIDLNAYEIGKNFPVDLGLVSDPKLTLGRLADILEAGMSQQQTAAAQSRAQRIGQENRSKLDKQLQNDAANRDAYPLRAARFMEELAKHVPEDTMVFDEALTTSPDLTRYLPPTFLNHFFQTRGGSLGVGIPGALGIKLANPDKTVIGFTGDGGSMYTIQALWTAAHHNIGAKFVICNNQSYMLLKLNILQYWREQVGVEVHEFPHSFDLKNPVVDFASLARSMGVPGICVDRPEDVEAAVQQMMAHDGPFLIDMVISSDVPH
jgi:benzoylformate decarboxylase